jgi:hypothetical protein
MAILMGSDLPHAGIEESSWTPFNAPYHRSMLALAG